jgi:prepilin-type N-terminal cleavage/methylation domain-containing protein
MISATGNKRGHPSSGFSLIEILLVLALVAVAGSIVIYNFAAFADRDGSLDTKETVHAAIRKGRYLAASSGSVVSLRTIKDPAQLILSSPTLESVTFELAETFGRSGRGSINFYAVPAGKGSTPLPEPERTRHEITAIEFAPDRSSTPFVIEIDEGQGAPQRLVYDPFSSLQRAPTP